jgi:hypothetical protein
VVWDSLPRTVGCKASWKINALFGWDGYIVCLLAWLLGSRVARYTLIILLLWLWAGDGLRWRASVLDCNGGFAFTLL